MIKTHKFLECGHFIVGSFLILFVFWGRVAALEEEKFILEELVKILELKTEFRVENISRLRKAYYNNYAKESWGHFEKIKHGASPEDIKNIRQIYPEVPMKED